MKKYKIKSKQKKQCLFQTSINFALKILIGFSCTMLAFLILITFIDVVGRYFFNMPLIGSTELTEIGLALLVFSILPVVIYQQRNIVIDILDFMIPEKIKYWVLQIHLAVTAFGFYYISQYSSKISARMFRRDNLSEYLEIPMGYIVMFGQYICYVTIILLILLIIKNFRDPDDFDKKEGSYGN